MTSRLLIACFMAAVPLAAQQEQEHPKIPNDSVEVTVTGCLNKRVLVADDVRQPDVSSGPRVHSHAFRLQGKKDLVETVKKNNKQRVEITGLIKKSALMESGVKFKGGRVTVGGGTSGMGPAPNQAPDSTQTVPVLDMSSVQLIGGDCKG